MSLNELLEKLDACKDSREWVSTQPDLQTAWKACPRGDWMVWLLAFTEVSWNDNRLRLIACDIAESMLHLVPPGEDRPRMAIETVRRYIKGEATLEEMADARAAAYAALNAAKTTADGSSSADVIAAFYTAYCASFLSSAYNAAYHAALNAAHASIVRKYFPECPEIRGV